MCTCLRFNWPFGNVKLIENKQSNVDTKFEKPLRGSMKSFIFGILISCSILADRIIVTSKYTNVGQITNNREYHKLEYHKF